MTREDYHVAKSDYLIGSDMEAHAAIQFVLALIDARRVEILTAGPGVLEEDEMLKANTVAQDIVTELLHDAEEFSGEEVN